MRLLIIGIPEATHVGGHFIKAAHDLGIDANLRDSNAAFAGPKLLRMAVWHLMGRRPVRMRAFGAEVIDFCRRHRPEIVLTTGQAPVEAGVLRTLREMGLKLANFLTDDPWNPRHRAAWFMEALPCYDHIFTPRRANFPELEALAAPRIHYLPFGYEPLIHHPPEPMTSEEQARWSSDVLFIGGGDIERATVMRSLRDRGFNLSLWGGYWDRMSDLKAFARGHAGPVEFRRLVACAGVNLCLVRQANRDGHSMRSFELPAVGGCMVVEDTGEHREIFGPDGECVRYFSTMDELATVVAELLAQPEKRRLMADRVRQRVCLNGRNTYRDRLMAILDTCDSNVRSGAQI